MAMQNQKKIMPTFNKNKRPRQVLFAHPNNDNSTNANFRGNFPSSSGSAHRPNKQPRMGPNNQNFVVRPPMNSNYNVGHQWNGMPNNNSRGNFPASTHPNPFSSSPQPTGYGFGAGGWASSTAGAGSMNDSWQRWAGVPNPRPPIRPPPTQSRAPRSWGAPLQGPQPRFPSQPPPTGTYWQQNTGPHQMNSFPPQSPRHNSANNQQSSIPAEKQQSAFVVDDRSLKVLTASIADVRNWSQHMDKIGSMICEVFGVMNSAISSDVSGVAKKFTLKNEDQTLKCIFYETDRHLPKLTRDQWLRCVGSLDQKSGLFRCVSIRPASQAERQVMASLIAASKSTMREHLAAVQEP